jgi:hypothetical protein
MKKGEKVRRKREDKERIYNICKYIIYEKKER